MVAQNKEQEAQLYSCDLFSPDTSRLWKLNDIKKDYCIYLLNTLYEDGIEQRYQVNHNRFQVVFYKNESPTVALDLIAVRFFLNHCSKPKLWAAPLKYTYYNKMQRIQTGHWQLVKNPELFFKYHQTHRLKYFFNKLNETTALIKLRDMQLTLKKSGDQGNRSAASKATALQDFLQAIDCCRINDFITILTQENHPIYKSMVKPRPQVYYPLPFLVIDFTSHSETQTTTYKLLAELKASEPMKNLMQEYNSQYAQQQNSSSKNSFSC